MIDQIRQVRSFNRTVTQRVGALNNSFLARGRPLSEARLIYEIGKNGAELRHLREKLALDSGYLSRLLRSLERQGLVEVQNDAEDAKVSMSRSARVARSLSRQRRLKLRARQTAKLFPYRLI